MIDSTPSPARTMARGVGTVTAWLITGGLNVVAIVCALFLWLAWLTGDYQSDRDMVENDGVWLTFMALVGGGSAIVSLVLDAVAVRLRWMPRWTLAIPAVLLAATALAYVGTSVG
ncbi:hypothetical protein [Micromonospora chokoriensis]|uniref:hypothetical protein n=1 Tax=Micromonospora chokoriensis TaxID=356851 RepID=UPI000A82646C|nr:hypothetical protein [Micromonospora chokoriensis]